MNKKAKGNTGFRNEKLFCFNCGDSYEVAFPQPVDMMTVIMKGFAKNHENCKPTWREPVNDVEGKTELQNAQWWAANGEHGLSSKTMYNCLSRHLQTRSLKNDHPSHPRDPDDFKRCYKLLQAVPQWKSQLHKLKSLSTTWASLVDNWDKLTNMYEENVKTEWKNHNKIGMHEFMDSLDSSLNTPA